MANPTTSGIYKITAICGDTSRYYIGHSIDLRKRKRVHWRLLATCKHPNPPMQNAWNKYGKEAFFFEVIESCPVAHLVEREQFHLDSFVAGGALVFNIKRECVESRQGVKDSAETIAKRALMMEVLWKDPAFRMKVTNAVGIAFSSPEVRERHRVASLRAQNRPEVKEHQKNIQRIAQNRPEVKAQKSAAVHAALSSAASRARRAATNALPEVKARRSAAAKAWRRSPEVRKRLSSISAEAQKNRTRRKNGTYAGD